MRLTDKLLKSLAATGKRYEIADGLGLSVRISPAGAITFQYRYRFRGKPYRHDLGTYPLTTLAEARDRHHAARKLLDQDQDPAEVKQQAEREEQAAWTVENLVDDFLKRKIARERKRPEYAKYLLKHNVVDTLGKRKVKDVTTREIVSTLEKIVDRGAPVLANRTASICKQMFGYAVQKGLRSDNPCSVITKASVGGREQPRTRYLSYGEIWKLWQGLDTSSIPADFKLAPKILLVTGQRRGELMFAEWSEIDIPRKVWLIPAKRSKNGRPHTVPLSSLAVDLFVQLRECSTGKRYLFPSPTLKKPERPCDSRVLNKVLARVTSKIDLTGCSPHALRHTFSTLMSELGVPLHVIEKILNHSLGGMLAVYNHHDFLPERKVALQAWADRLVTLMRAESKSEVETLEEVWGARSDVTIEKLTA